MNTTNSPLPSGSSASAAVSSYWRPVPSQVTAPREVQDSSSGGPLVKDWLLPLSIMALASLGPALGTPVIERAPSDAVSQQEGDSENRIWSSSSASAVASLAAAERFSSIYEAIEAMVALDPEDDLFI